MPAKKKNTPAELVQLIQDVHAHGVNTFSREIYLHGHFNDGCENPESEIDFRVAANFIKNLHILDLQGRSTITVHMSIGGGSWEYGMAMFDAIQAATSPITIVAYSLASSMSGILLQAAKKRIMMPHTHFMLHYGSIGFEGSSMAASEVVKLNDRECKVMLDIFTQRAMNGLFFKDKKMTYKKVKEYLDGMMKQKGDWYLTAPEAVFYGLADDVLGLNGCKI